MSFKTFDLAHDVASVISAINEVVFISSSILSNDLDTKFYSNIASGTVGVDLGGYWETIYDSSPTSSLSTPILDITYGIHTSSIYNVQIATSASIVEKNKVYRMMAGQLLGDTNAPFSFGGQNVTECFFLMIKRNIQKDEIKKGATAIVLNLTGSQITGSDTNAASSFNQGPGGDYAALYNSANGTTQIGQVWYNAGVIVLAPNLIWSPNAIWSGSLNLAKIQVSGSTINQMVDGLRKYAISSGSSAGALQSIGFHNQTNLFSTAYFCRAENTEFNYSSNPTFVDGNQRIRVTSGSNILQTRTYVTTLGLYDANDNLLAVAKVNKPITKSPDNESIFRVRLDY